MTWILLAAALMLGAQTGDAEMQHARGTFEIVMTPAASADSAPDAPGRMTLAKTYRGGIEGTGTGEMLASMGADQSGGYIAMERIRGTVNGRQGAFTVLHRGLMDRGANDLSIVVVPGSGAGELAGITGVYHLTVEGGVHRYDLEYSLPTP